MTTDPLTPHLAWAIALSFRARARRPLARKVIKFTLDLAMAGLVWLLVELLETGTRPSLWHFAAWITLAGIVNATFRLCSPHYRSTGFSDFKRMAVASLTLCVTAVALGSLAPWRGDPLSLNTLVIASLITCAAWGSLRGAILALHEQPAPATADRSPEAALIVGAGQAGILIAREIQRHPELGIRIEGFVDDALEKRKTTIQGVPVLGPTSMLPALIKGHGITQVILAIPSAPGDFLRQMSAVVQEAGVRLKTVPGIYELLGPRTWKPELRDIAIEDLLRRDPIRLDQSALHHALQGARVLITGAGGSIGSELARQIAAFHPSKIILLGRGENSLWETERSLAALFPRQDFALELCDIRNALRLGQVFQAWGPQVVLHAAAHKHVPYLEHNPEEGVENNVFGTENVLNMALAYGTRTFVNISTDKAVNPTNVLGATKRLAECLVIRAARRAPEGTRYVSVRFGNVLGSRGSVIPIFRDQIKAGGPLTVTHPDMTRYFMTIPEASQLALQAGILSQTAKVYVLDMGEPVKIVDWTKPLRGRGDQRPSSPVAR